MSILNIPLRCWLYNIFLAANYGISIGIKALFLIVGTGFQLASGFCTAEFLASTSIIAEDQHSLRLLGVGLEVIKYFLSPISLARFAVAATWKDHLFSVLQLLFAFCLSLLSFSCSVLYLNKNSDEAFKDATYNAQLILDRKQRIAIAQKNLDRFDKKEEKEEIATNDLLIRHHDSKYLFHSEKSKQDRNVLVAALNAEINSKLTREKGVGMMNEVYIYINSKINGISEDNKVNERNIKNIRFIINVIITGILELGIIYSMNLSGIGIIIINAFALPCLFLKKVDSEVVLGWFSSGSPSVPDQFPSGSVAKKPVDIPNEKLPKNYFKNGEDRCNLNTNKDNYSHFNPNNPSQYASRQKDFNCMNNKGNHQGTGSTEAGNQYGTACKKGPYLIPRTKDDENYLKMLLHVKEFKTENPGIACGLNRIVNAIKIHRTTASLLIDRAIQEGLFIKKGVTYEQTDKFYREV